MSQDYGLWSLTVLHASAQSGTLATTGPYGWLRHPAAALGGHQGSGAGRAHR